MKTIMCLLILILSQRMVLAQLTESFSDGDFTSNPEWSGDTGHFTVNSSGQLQLNSSDENTSALSTAITLADSMEWNFWVRLNFSPSDNNHAKIYLVADQQDLNLPLNGYYLKLGESGSDDAIELFRQNGSSHSSLCRGIPGRIASSFSIRIKVTRLPDGSWSLYSDLMGGADFTAEATAFDNSITTGNWFGITCKYTSSNSSKFYLDEIYAGRMVVDRDPPGLVSVGILTTNSLKVRFSEAVEQASASNAGNYSVDNGLGNPAIAQRDPTDHSLVYLAFDQVFKPDTPYTLTLSGISDPTGNILGFAEHHFSWHAARAFDLLINEIMADPDPVVDLPPFEYIELFNRSEYPVDLTGWSFTIGSAVKSLSPYILSPKCYVLLTDDAAVDPMSAYADVISFTSFQLSNTGVVVTLKDQAGSVIHSVSYTDRWYQDEYKQDGGWSLEMIDPDNPCGENGNWKASVHSSGGSPGKVNSVRGSNPDLVIPQLLRVGVPDPGHILVTFNEAMDSLALKSAGNYFIDGGIGLPISVRALAPSYRQAELELASPVNEGTIYTLTLTGNFPDCCGNLVPDSSSVRLALPVEPGSGDLIINEILFNPYEDGDDFIELYNRSGLVFDLRNLVLASYDSISGMLSEVNPVIKDPILFFPGEYFALTKDTASLLRYYSCYAAGLIQMEQLPPMNNESGSVAVALKKGTLIDGFYYREEMHFPLLTSVEGVSLERIHPDRPTNDATNWHSASAGSGYATPALRNSQLILPPVSTGEIELSPEVFSPNNDGTDDNLIIRYSFPEPGTVASVIIYDMGGHQVRHLVNNELCGTSGTWVWDGVTENRMKAPIGMYLVLVDVFDMKGNHRKIRKVAVLGGYI